MAHMFGEKVAETIIAGCHWSGAARTEFFGMEQARIVHEGDARWIGVTVSLHYDVAGLYAGRILKDGTFTSPEAQSDSIDTTDPQALIQAAKDLWQRLDELTPG